MRLEHILIVLLLSSGCAVNRYAGKEFTSSKSTCMDGVLVNIDAAGCEKFYINEEDDGKVFKIKCTESNFNNFWTLATFQAVPVGVADGPPSGFKSFCSDVNVDLFVHYVTLAPGVRRAKRER
jgi:hypothetical protein